MRLGQIAEEILKENHISPEKIEIAGIETAQELVANSYGVCLCSSLGVREYQNRLDIYSFGKQPVTWKFVAALRVGGYMTEPLKYLIQLYCKLRSNGMPVPLLRNGYSIFNGTKYR